MFSPYYWHNYRVKVLPTVVNRIWWKLMPGTLITVKWPVGWTDPIPAGGGGTIQVESADPNDHYRPWMEQNVGKQGWDWDWTLTNNDINENSLTIKFRKGKEKHATIAALRWT